MRAPLLLLLLRCSTRTRPVTAAAASTRATFDAHLAAPAVFTLSGWRLLVGAPGSVLTASSPSGLDALTLSSLSAEAVNASIYEGDGAFDFALSTVASWAAPTVATATQAPSGAVTLRGAFNDGPAGASWTLAVRDPGDGSGHLAFSLAVSSPAVAGATAVATTLVVDGLAGEHLAGLGTQFSFVELANRAVPVFASEQGVGRGLQPLTAIMDAADRGAGGSCNTTYSHVPAVFSSAGRGLALTTLEWSEWAFGAAGAGLAVRALAPRVDGRFWGALGGDLLTAAAGFRSISGTQPPLPDWVSRGAIVGLEGGTDAVLAALARIDAAVPNAPISGVWMQDLSGGVNYTTGLPRYGVYWDWRGVNETTYPNYTSRLLPALAARNVTVLSYVNPHLAPSGQLFAEAAARGALVRLESGALFMAYGGAAMVDLFNASTAAWYVDALVDAFVESASSGGMVDFGEAFPVTARGGLAAHGAYPAAWAAVAAAVARGVDARRGGAAPPFAFWMRASSPASPAAVPLFWLGDQTTTWDGFDGLASVPRALMTAALAGAGVTHFDIGGYTSLAVGGVPLVARSKELFMRSAELAAFTWAFRTHPGSDPAVNAQLDSDAATAAHFFAMAALFVALAPYRAEVRAALAADGTPVFAPTAARFAAAPWSLDAQLLLGPRLLVAPVLAAGAADVAVWLPRGRWRHAVTGEEFAGADAAVRVRAPVGTPCALWWEGA